MTLFGMAGLGSMPKLPVWLQRMGCALLPAPSSPPSCSETLAKKALGLVVPGTADHAARHAATIAGSMQP